MVDGTAVVSREIPQDSPESGIRFLFVYCEHKGGRVAAAPVWTIIVSGGHHWLDPFSPAFRIPKKVPLHIRSMWEAPLSPLGGGHPHTHLHTAGLHSAYLLQT